MTETSETTRSNWSGAGKPPKAVPFHQRLEAEFDLPACVPPHPGPP